MADDLHTPPPATPQPISRLDPLVPREPYGKRRKALIHIFTHWAKYCGWCNAVTLRATDGYMILCTKCGR
jgi:hypothetical protein